MLGFECCYLIITLHSRNVCVIIIIIIISKSPKPFGKQQFGPIHLGRDDETVLTLFLCKFGRK